MKIKILFKLIVTVIVFLLIVPSFSVALPFFQSTNYENIFERNINYSVDDNDNITKAMEEAYMASLSAGIIVNDTLVWSQGFGNYRGYYNPLLPKFYKTPTKDTIYMAGSISKSITATAIFQLCEKHLLNINDSLSKYLNFEFKDPYYPDINITIKMLLNHTSSLKDSTFSFVSPILDKFGSFPMLFLKILSFNKLESLNEKFWRKDVPPGTEFHYANVGYGILQYLIEIISGNSFEEYCKENIFKPLEMYNTSFHFKDFKLNQQAMPYFWINESQYYMRLRHYDIPLLAAGSLRTTVEDLSHFLIAHMNNGTYKNVRILNDSNVNLMHTSTITILDENTRCLYSSYCLGWMICNDTNFSGHGGDIFGSHAMMIMNAANNTGLIYFWNSSEISNRSFSDKVKSRKNVENELLKKIINSNVG